MSYVHVHLGAGGLQEREEQLFLSSTEKEIIVSFMRYSFD